MPAIQARRADTSPCGVRPDPSHELPIAMGPMLPVQVSTLTGGLRMFRVFGATGASWAAIVDARRDKRVSLSQRGSTRPPISGKRS
jgi:hypothetical protein